MQSLQSVPIPLLSSIINIHNNNNTTTNYINSNNRHHPLKTATAINNNNSNNLTPRTTIITTMPKSNSYNETAISTELECFITKSSSSGSIGINEDDIDDIDLSSNDSNDQFETQLTTNKNDIELININDNKNINENSNNKYHKKRRRRKKKHHRRHFCNEYQPQWLLQIANLDRTFSSKIHKLSCGTIDYLFVFGAFVFGSKFMPITILLSIFLVDIPGFIYLLLSCTITVTITQFGKKICGRHRPDPKTLAPKKLDFRTRLTNYSFPSGDTAQVQSQLTIPS